MFLFFFKFLNAVGIAIDDLQRNVHAFDCFFDAKIHPQTMVISFTRGVCTLGKWLPASADGIPAGEAPQEDCNAFIFVEFMNMLTFLGFVVHIRLELASRYFVPSVTVTTSSRPRSVSITTGCV